MKKFMGRAFRILSIGCFSIWILAGCATFNQEPDTNVEQEPIARIQPETRVDAAPVPLTEEKIEEVQPPDDFVHTVRWRGETLSHIAKWYTGQFRHWKVLAEANPTLDPNRIHKGNRIIIPESMLKTRTPLPKNFMARTTPQKTNEKTTVKPSREPEQDKAIPLFGPKEHAGN